MNYTETKLPHSELEITVDLPFAEFEPYTKKAAVRISENVEIEGFRKGKAPYEMVRSRIGEAAIYEEAAELAVRKTYSDIFKKLVDEKKAQGDASFTPIGRPEITVTKLAPGNDLQFKIKLALLPQVKLPDYKEIAKRIQKTKKETSVTDEEIQKTIYWIQESRAPLVTVDRPAQMDDTVEIDFDVKHEGVKIEGGNSRNHPLVIGRGKFIPGFEDQLIGMKVGDEKSFKLVSPEDWHEKNLAGKELSFGVKMNLVQERQKKALDDEFAKSLGEFPTFGALKQSIRDGISKEKQEKEDQRVCALVIEEISKDAEIEIPSVLIDAEIDKMFTELRSGIESMGMKWEDYLVHVKKSVEELRREWQTEAVKRVRVALSLRTIADLEKVQVAEEEIEARANDFLQRFQTSDDASKNIDPVELREYTRGVLRNEKVFELLDK